MVLRLTSCSPRRSGFFVTVISRVFSQDLTPASRRQDHTTSPSASARFVKRASASTASRSAFVTCARPSVGQDGQGYIADLPDGLSEIYLQRGLDSPNQLDRAGEFSLCEQTNWLDIKPGRSRDHALTGFMVRNAWQPCLSPPRKRGPITTNFNFAKDWSHSLRNNTHRGYGSPLSRGRPTGANPGYAASG